MEDSMLQQKTKRSSFFTALKAALPAREHFVMILLVLSVTAIPTIVRGECHTEGYGSGAHPVCDSGGECSDQLSGFSGAGYWDFNYGPIDDSYDCKCWWVGNYTTGYEWQCYCCGYHIPARPICSDGNTCCGNTLCDAPSQPPDPADTCPISPINNVSSAGGP